MHRTPVQLAALVVGATFLLVGILGFVPGLTTHYGDLSFAGHTSEAKLLGLFQVSVLHNLVHVAFGVLGLALSRTAAGSRSFLTIGGGIYLVLTAYGLLVGQNSALNFVPVNTADDLLHLLLGVTMLALGTVLGSRRESSALR